VAQDTHYVAWKVDGELCTATGSKTDMEDLRHFMKHVSPLKRDDISEVLPIIEKKERQ
jgi:hypothetical protein